ncbi:MAG: hypothetical protein Q7R49_02330 [Candidatus Daviesbacteria bacterium]|nr:hypothetical protein [Candidatus Daviesbacteria bacterium]
MAQAKVEQSGLIGASYYEIYWTPLNKLSPALTQTEQALKYLLHSRPSWKHTNTYAQRLRQTKEAGSGIDTNVAFVYETTDRPVTIQVQDLFEMQKTELRSPEKFLTFSEGELTREIEIEPDWGVEVRRAEIPIRRLGNAINLTGFQDLDRTLEYGATLVARMPNEAMLASLKLLSNGPIFEQLYSMYLPVVKEMRNEDNLVFTEDPKHLVLEVHFTDMVGRLRGMIAKFESQFGQAPWLDEEIIRLEEQQRIIELTLNAKRHHRDLFHNQVDNALTVFRQTLQEQEQSAQPLIS